MRIVIIGLGVIGGSYAMALKKKGFYGKRLQKGDHEGYRGSLWYQPWRSLSLF